jgi:hypothetical protein
MSLGIVQPLKASEILLSIKDALNPAEFIKQVLCPSGSFDTTKAQGFLLQLKHEVKKQHGIELDLNLIVDEALEFMAASGQFSESEIATAEEFYSQLIKSEIKVCNSHRSKKKKPHKKKSPEVVLPDKMAIGFVCILSGALLCALPFGFTQGVGTGLIATGVYSVLDGAREGEKPYHIDSETGQRIDQNTSPSVGVGVGF